MQQRNYVPLPLPTDGVHRELSQVDMAPSVLRDAENWLYRDGRLRVRDGLTLLTANAVTGRPVGFANWFDAATLSYGRPTPVLVLATTSHYYVWSQVNQSWTDLTGSLTGDETTHNIMRVFQKSTGSPGTTATTMYGCNGVDDNKKYVYGDANVSAMGGSPPRAKAMMILGDRMLLGNLTQNAGATYTGALGPQCVAVSTSQNPESGWSTVLNAQLQDTPGEIVCMLEMGNLQGAIYKDDAIYMATAQSDVVPFTFPLKQVVPGPVSPRAVVRVNDSMHIYLATNGDIIKFDGVSAVPLGRHLQRYVLDNWNRLMAVRSHGWYDHENNEVCFAFPDQYTGDCTREVIIRISDQDYPLWPYRFDTYKISAGIRAILPGGVRFVDLDGVPSGETLADLTLALSLYNAIGTSLVLGESGGYTFTNTGTTDNGGSIPAFFEGGLNAFDTPHLWKSIQYLDLVFSDTGASQLVTTTLKGTSFGQGPTTLSTASADIDAVGQHRTYHRCSARRLALRVSCNASQTVELNAGHLAYVSQGLR